MKYCTHCGKEILDEAVICPGCGCPVNANGNATLLSNNDGQEENPSLAKVALGLGFIIPIAGIILGIIGIVKYKTSRFQNQCISAILVSIIAWVLWAVVWSL